MQESVGRKAIAQLADQHVGTVTLGRSHRVGVPFGRLEVVDGHKGRLAPHGQAHVAVAQRGIDLMAQAVEIRPGIVAEGLGDARMFGHAADLHIEVEIDLGKAGGA